MHWFRKLRFLSIHFEEVIQCGLFLHHALEIFSRHLFFEILLVVWELGRVFLEQEFNRCLMLEVLVIEIFLLGHELVFERLFLLDSIFFFFDVVFFDFNVIADYVELLFNILLLVCLLNNRGLLLDYFLFGLLFQVLRFFHLNFLNSSFFFWFDCVFLNQPALSQHFFNQAIIHYFLFHLSRFDLGRIIVFRLLFSIFIAFNVLCINTHFWFIEILLLFDRFFVQIFSNWGCFNQIFLNDVLLNHHFFLLGF